MVRAPSRRPALRLVLLAATVLAGLSTAARADIDDGKNDNDPTSPPLPSGQHISPTVTAGSVFQGLNPGLANYPSHLAAQAVKTAISPDGATLLVLTSGYNLVNGPTGAQDNAASTEYVFVYDIAGANARNPQQRQVIQVPNTYVGLVYAPDGGSFFVSGGVDDVVYQYRAVAAGPAPTYALAATVALGHKGVGVGRAQKPVVSGLAVSPDGTRVVAANIFNDSISVIRLDQGSAVTELDLRPGIVNPAQSGVAGGETPFGVAITPSNVALVTSQRDRELVAVDITGTPRVVSRIALPGNPNSIVLSPDGYRAYVAQDNSDTVAVIDATNGNLIAEIPTAAPPGLLTTKRRYTGADPNGLALSPDGLTLYVTNGGSNSLAVIPLDVANPQVAGLIPTGWNPNSVSISADGRSFYVVNGKSNAGPAPDELYGNTARLTLSGTPASNAAAIAQSNAANQYVLQLEAAGLLSAPVPARADLGELTLRVAANNGYSVRENAADREVMRELHRRIRHVIYIIKENRTYDQVLGDLPRGNGDPALAVFGQPITPNLHQIATDFVTLDNFFDSGEVSGNGWQWSTAGREADTNEKFIPLNYSGRGAPYNAEGEDRNVNVALPDVASRIAADPRYPNDPNLLPGTNYDAGIDGPDGARQQGYIWSSALRAGLSVRNYGFYCDLTRYNTGDAASIPEDPTPFADHLQVAYSANPQLLPVTDPYFRAYDNSFPDAFREQEWAREFAGYVQNGDLPALSLVRFMHDHTGNFSLAIAGVNTPEKQQADNDLSVGLLLDQVAHSPYASDTLVFVIEDDSQDGPDHVDAHRSIAFIAGPYVRQRAVVSTRYSTVNFLRTMEDVLGIGHLNLNDNYQRPMTDVFDLAQTSWTYSAVKSQVLSAADSSGLPDVAYAEGPRLRATHDASYWTEKTRGFDWTAEDRAPADLYNHILWEGMTGGRPYPGVRDGADLSAGRDAVLRERALPPPPVAEVAPAGKAS